MDPDDDPDHLQLELIELQRDAECPNSEWSAPIHFHLNKSSPLCKKFGHLCCKVPSAPTRMFAGESSLCPGCGKVVYFAEKVMSLGRNWHRPCLRCGRCKKTLTSGGHAEHEGQPYCHVPCYGYLFGPKGVNIGEVGCYIYEKDENDENEIFS